MAHPNILYGRGHRPVERGTWWDDRGRSAELRPALERAGGIALKAKAPIAVGRKTRP